MIELSKVTFNNKEYDLVYNDQTGYYEAEIEAVEAGGLYNTNLEFQNSFDENLRETKIIQILAKEKNVNTSEETLVYFLSKDDLEIKDVIEFENYDYIIDEETNKKTVFDVMKKVNAENEDIVILQRNGSIDYIGIINDIQNENGEVKRQVTLKYISNIFDESIICGDETIISETGIEDFIAQEIEDNFTNSDDTLLNIKWLDVEVKTHTKIKKSVDTENGIYNFHTYITNCSQNYNIVLDFSYTNKRIKLTIYKQEDETELIDTTVPDISEYEEEFETSVTAKVVVKTDTDVQTWYLLSDRTTTQDIDNTERAKGKKEVVYTQNSEDAEQTALNCFKSNTYKHYISFKINRESKIFNVSKMKIGTPLSVRTNNNIILNTYVSAVEDSGGKFLKITCGNMRINYIDKILQERR